jgi:hypothetical protein
VDLIHHKGNVCILHYVLNETLPYPLTGFNPLFARIRGADSFKKKQAIKEMIEQITTIHTV